MEVILTAVNGLMPDEAHVLTTTILDSQEGCQELLRRIREAAVKIVDDDLKKQMERDVRRMPRSSLERLQDTSPIVKAELETRLQRDAMRAKIRETNDWHLVIEAESRRLTGCLEEDKLEKDFHAMWRFHQWKEEQTVGKEDWEKRTVYPNLFRYESLQWSHVRRLPPSERAIVADILCARPWGLTEHSDLLPCAVAVATLPATKRRADGSGRTIRRRLLAE